jgi:hypothetical protein
MTGQFLTVGDVAAITHEAVRQLRHTQGDTSLRSWERLFSRQRKVVTDRVRFFLEDRTRDADVFTGLSLVERKLVNAIVRKLEPHIVPD